MFLNGVEISTQQEKEWQRALLLSGIVFRSESRDYFDLDLESLVAADFLIVDLNHFGYDPRAEVDCLSSLFSHCKQLEHLQIKDAIHDNLPEFINFFELTALKTLKI